MKLPEFVKRIGTIEGESRVYVEDYVYTYLNELREKKDILPLRAVLFGHVCQKEGRSFYFVYGAACVIDEMQNGRDEEQVRKLFFDEYELIGYVNIRKDKQFMPEKSKGYYVFYETNEAMQNYLVSSYRSENKGQEQEEGASKRRRRKRACPSGAIRLKLSGEALRRFFYGFCVVLFATAVTSINDYERMHGFVEIVHRAVSLTDIVYR